jgi:hypothetical protein
MLHCDDGISRSFVIDCCVRHKGGAMLAFEVDFNHPTTAVKLEMLKRVGIIPIVVNPSGVDDWVKEPQLLEQEMSYWIRQACKPTNAIAARN